MQTLNDSSSKQDLGTTIALYFFIGTLGLFALGLILYIFFGT